MKSRTFKSLTLALFILTGCSPSLFKKENNLPKGLETGDLVFLDLDCGPLCNAIERATLDQFKVAGPRLSHVGIVEKIGDDIFVWEAWPKKGVGSTTLFEFLSRVKAGENETHGYYLGRLQPAFRSIGVVALEKIREKIGASYDDEFKWGDNRFYCSELIAYGFEVANSLQPQLFQPRPMSFGPRGSSEWKEWRNYFNELGVEMPERAPGISPLGLYLEGQRRLFLKNSKSQ